jgi:hypothetical protein
VTQVSSGRSVALSLLRTDGILLVLAPLAVGAYRRRA